MPLHHKGAINSQSEPTCIPGARLGQTGTGLLPQRNPQGIDPFTSIGNGMHQRGIFQKTTPDQVANFQLNYFKSSGIDQITLSQGDHAMLQA